MTILPVDHLCRACTTAVFHMADSPQGRLAIAHPVRTQHGVTASAGQRRGDVEVRNYLRDQAGSRSLVFDLSIAHDSTCSRTGACRTRRTWMRRYILLRSVRLLPISNNTLTIRTFLFSPQSLIPPSACMASFCVFFFYRPTGRLRHTSLPLECDRKPTTDDDPFIVLTETKFSRKHSCSSARHSTTA